MHVKKGDNVIVISGKDKGKSGKIIKSLPKQERVVVEGLNMHKRRIKSRRAGQAGQTVDISLPIHVSNIQLAKGATKKK